MRAAIAQSVQQVATGWTVRGSNSGRRRDFLHTSGSALGPTKPRIPEVAKQSIAAAF